MLESTANVQERGGEKSRKSCVSRQGSPEAGTPSEQGQSRGLACIWPRDFG